jgi:hypothetical protein
MNNRNNAQNHRAVFDVIESQIVPFIDSIRAVGYATGTLTRKKVALRKFVRWRRRLRNPRFKADEAEVAEFIKESFRPDDGERYLSSRALFGFLEYVRRQGAIEAFAPKAPDTVALRLERRYADFLRNDKGLTESSVRHYLPVVANLFDYLHKERDTTAVRRLDATIVRDFLFERSRNSEVDPIL